MKENGYRLNVGLIIANKEGKLLICKRKGMNSWQFPQGGIDYGETPLKAARRELFEEVGIKSKSTKLISDVEEWLKYEVPKKSRRRRFLDKKFKGQKQKWFFLKFLGTDKDININSHSHPEFREWKWEEPKLIIYEAIGFKKIVYEKVISEYFKLIH